MLSSPRASSSSAMVRPCAWRPGFRGARPCAGGNAAGADQTLELVEGDSFLSASVLDSWQLRWWLLSRATRSSWSNPRTARRNCGTLGKCGGGVSRGSGNVGIVGCGEERTASSRCAMRFVPHRILRVPPVQAAGQASATLPMDRRATRLKLPRSRRYCVWPAAISFASAMGGDLCILGGNRAADPAPFPRPGAPKCSAAAASKGRQRPAKSSASICPRRGGERVTAFSIRNRAIPRLISAWVIALTSASPEWASTQATTLGLG